MDNDWQNTLSSVKDRNHYAFENSKFSDVEFSVDGREEATGTIPAHKYMLAINSPVFEAMFYGPLAETTRVINISDCTKEGLREMLRYVYTDDATITADNVMELLYLSRKYSMSFLENKCIDFIYENVNPEDVFLVLPRVQSRILEERCWSIIDKDTKRAVESQAFVDIPRELLCKILSRDTLKIKELELFKAVDRWVCKKIKDRSLDYDGDTKRGILGEDVIRLIRFPTMKMIDFVEHVLDCEILERSEVTEVLKKLNSLEPATSVFNSTPRSGTFEQRRLLLRRRKLLISPNPSRWLSLLEESDSDIQRRSRSRSHSRSRSRSRTRSRSRSRIQRSRSRSLSPTRNRRPRSRSRSPYRRRRLFFD